MKISVVIASYNSGAYLRDAVESILAQDACDFECIVVDDGSTDQSCAVLDTFKDSRLRVHKLPTNCGIATARNVGMALSQGDYIAVMDADDVALPNRLTLQAEFLDANPSVDIVAGRTTRVAETLERVIDNPSHPIEDGIIKAYLLLLNGSAMVNPTTMIRKSFLSSNTLLYPSRRIDEDHAFWIKCVLAGGRFSCLHDVVLYKRRHSQNVTMVFRDTKEPAKTPLRMELLSAFFPALTCFEIRNLARLMQKGLSLKAREIVFGLAAGYKALSEQRSYFGESHAHLNKILRGYLSQAEAALRSPAGRNAP